MAALDFPSSPTTGDLYSANGSTWRYDGEKWVPVGFSDTDLIRASSTSSVDGYLVWVNTRDDSAAPAYAHSTTSSVWVDASAATIYAGDFIATSDVRLKEQIQTLDGTRVYDMRGVSYIKNGVDGAGVIAQEMEQIAPEVVHEDADGMKSVAYGNLVGYLIEAVKDLKTQIEEINSRIK